MSHMFCSLWVRMFFPRFASTSGSFAAEDPDATPGMQYVIDFQPSFEPERCLASSLF